ncbi:MAG: membrane protein insertion efficiency factor YidD [Patescibacteria group bacterium]
MSIIRGVIQLLQKTLIQIIRWYQRILSPDTGFFRDRFPYGYCRFVPHCSEYAIQAIERFGLLKGSLRAAWRILRCHPFSAGGEDPVQSHTHSLTCSHHGMV